MEKICIVAILKWEEPFLDEWIAYHRMIGIDHFYLYDDDPLFPLAEFVKPYSEYVTVINWNGMDLQIDGQTTTQIKAYVHAVQHFACSYDWVIFMDGDEFIVLRKHQSVPDFLAEFDENCSAVSLHWHVFGHNGFYEDPPGLVTASLTRRMFTPSIQIKTFSRPATIKSVDSPHYCRLRSGSWLDVNHQPFKYVYPNPGLTDTAHINHYQCRSFVNWMDRAKRGDVSTKDDFVKPEHRWRLTEDSCLRHFVTTVAKDRNEYVDEYMLQYKEAIENRIKAIRKNNE